MMKKFIALLLAGTMALSVAACGGLSIDDANAEASTELNIYMWEQYISDELIANFEEENNCTVNLSYLKNETDAMDELTAGTEAYDLVMTSSVYMKPLIDGDYLKKIDKSNLPNSSTINDNCWLSKSYSVPYLMNYLYVVYDSETCPIEITGYKDLLNPALKGQISAMDGARNLFPMALAALGYSPNSVEEAEIAEAYDWLVRFQENVAEYGDGKQSLTKGEVSVAVMYDRAAAEVMAKKDTIKIAPFAEDKVRVDTDLFVIPAEAQHVDLAEKFLNYICDPEVMAANLEEFSYSCPNDAAVAIASETYKNAPERQFDYKNAVFFQQDVGEALEIYDDFYQKLKAGR